MNGQTLATVLSVLLGTGGLAGVVRYLRVGLPRRLRMDAMEQTLEFYTSLVAATQFDLADLRADHAELLAWAGAAQYYASLHGLDLPAPLGEPYRAAANTQPKESS